LKYYPIAVRLKNKKAVVVGGGVVAERKVEGLLSAGARVSVVAPVLTKDLAAHAKKGSIVWIEGVARRRHLAGADIVIAATSDSNINKKVSAWTKRAHRPVNVVDDQQLSNFISPAVFKRQKAIVAVYTDGRDPALSRDLRIFLEGHWDDFISFRDRL
jgi:siroheme synthase-like protein